MMDPHHPFDMLFLFAEYDFRLFESDCIGNECLLIAELVPEALQARASRPAAGRESPRPPQLWGWEGERRSQPAEHYHTEHIERLNDIVRLCALAHWHGLGDVVWLSYNCGTLGKPKVGQTVLDLVCEHIGGARRQWCACIPRCHCTREAAAYDLWLKAQWEKHTETLGYLYMNPPIGSDEEHGSGCKPSVGL